MSFEIKGTIHVIYATEQISESFKKRQFVLKTSEGKYEEFPQFQCTQDRCALLDNFSEGQEVTVSFNLRGRPYERKDGSGTVYFTNLEAWRIQSAEATATPAPATTAPAAHGLPQDDLPF